MQKEPIEENKPTLFPNIWVVLIIMILGFQLFNYMFLQKQSQTIPYNQFKSKIEQNIIKEVRIDGDQVVATLKGDLGEKPTYLRTTLPPF